jgi:hypothetical protein
VGKAKDDGQKTSELIALQKLGNKFANIIDVRQ